MRIIGEIAHPSLKITVFKMDNRISVKFENAQYEQTYKLRIDNDLESMKEVEKLVDAIFIADVQNNFIHLHSTKNSALGRFLPTPAEDEFEEII